MSGNTRHDVYSGRVSRSTTVQALSREIDDTLKLLREYQASHKVRPPPSDRTEVVGLLQQCLALCQDQYVLTREPIRTIHHFACTGGTLFSKCIAAMPNTQLLSEIDPLSAHTTNPLHPVFSATDLIGQIRQGTRDFDQTMLARIFLSGVGLLLGDASGKGLRLVVRDHAHSQFCTSQDPSSRPTLREILQQRHEVLSIVTVRDPIESYTSLCRNGWVHFRPATFDEYCARYLSFLSRYDQVHTIKYENFVHNPAETMQEICNVLALPYQDRFESLYSVFNLTGDSGRTGARIRMRQDRVVDPEFASEVRHSKNFRLLADCLRYS